MVRFAHVSIYLYTQIFIYANVYDVYDRTHVSKLYSIHNYFTSALGGDKVQISICKYADFTHVQTWSYVG